MAPLRRYWTLGILAVVAVGVALSAVRFWGRDDFWRVAVPGYLTGTGTLALAVVTYLLMRREGEDRRRLQNAEVDRERRLALSEARKVVAVWSASRSTFISVINASSGPILDVKLISGGYEQMGIIEGIPEDVPAYTWLPLHGLNHSYAPVILPNESVSFGGQWNYPVYRATQGGMVAVIAWTDPMGDGWKRSGRSDPERLPKPFSWPNDELLSRL